MIATFENYDNKFFQIKHCDDQRFLNVTKKFFTITNKEFDAKLNETIYTNECVIEYTPDKSAVLVPIPVAETFANYLFSNGVRSSSRLKYDETTNFELDDSWYEFFSTDRNGVNQVFCIESLMKRLNGVMQVPTGSGKSEMIVATAMSLKEPGNILLVTPFKSIHEELSNRFKKRGVEVPLSFDVNYKINVIQSAGYYNSNRFHNEECDKWMSNVKMILIDECENIADTLEILLNEKLTNYRYIYGFSASSDKLDGKILNASEGFVRYNTTAYKVMKYVGQSIVFIEPTLKLRYNVIKSSFSDIKLPPFLRNNQQALYANSMKSVVTSPAMDKCLKIILENKVDILYIPLFSWNNGWALYEKILRLGYNPVLWRSGEIRHELKLDDGVTIKNYSDLKKYCAEMGDKNRVDVIMSTSVGFLGIDIPQISDVALYVGTSFSRVSQPIGRAFRNKTPGVWIFEETGSNKNMFYQRCTWKRKAVIRNTYNFDYKEWNV